MPNYREMNVLSINFKCTFGQEASRAIDQPVPIPSDDADVHLRDFVYDHEPERERLFPPPKRNPVKVAISRATPSGNDNMHKRNPPGTRLAKMSNDPIRRHAKLDQGLDTGGTRLLVDKRRPRSLLPSPRSVSPRAHAGNLVRANDPCCLLRPEDIPDAIIFELKEIHLLE